MVPKFTKKPDPERVKIERTVAMLMTTRETTIKQLKSTTSDQYIMT